MFKAVGQWLFGAPTPRNWEPVRLWCEQIGASFKLTRTRDGFVILSTEDAVTVRIEWGPSQRTYLGSHELRLRGETGIDPQTYALLMPRALLNRLEREIYSQFTDSVQTRLDEQTPEEMRWLAMSPRIGGRQMGELAEAYAVVGNLNEWTQQWLEGPLSQALHALPTQLPAPLPGQTAADFALIAQRSRLVLRCAMPQPGVEAMAAHLQFFRLALRQARQYGQQD
jgi:hypothetical protein